MRQSRTQTPSVRFLKKRPEKGAPVIPPTATYTVATDVLFRELEGELVLLDTRSANYYSLNQTGTRVWHLLSSRTTIGDICEGLSSAYQLAEEELMADLIPFLQELQDVGLIHRQD